MEMREQEKQTPLHLSRAGCWLEREWRQTVHLHPAVYSYPHFCLMQLQVGSGLLILNWPHTWIFLQHGIILLVLLIYFYVLPLNGTYSQLCNRKQSILPSSTLQFQASNWGLVLYFLCERDNPENIYKCCHLQSKTSVA